jgi:RNA polymerase sigma-70 factor (ECF subfamily)
VADDLARARDDDLIARFQGGDRAAFQVLFERHAATIERFADRMLPARLRRRVSVADVMQDANLAALEMCEAFESRGDNSFRNWLLRVVELRVRETIRKHAGAARRAVGREVPREDRAATTQLAGDQATPSQVAIGLETEQIARAAMQALPEDYRDVLRLSREQHLPLKDIAERMGRSYEATKKLYGRALSAFTKEFARRRGESLG